MKEKIAKEYFRQTRKLFEIKSSAEITSKELTPGQYPFKILGISSSSENIRTNKTITKLGNRNGKKNNCIDILSDKQAELHMRRHGHG